MKTAIGVCLFAFAASFYAARAQESVPPFTRATIEQTEKSLVKALESDVEGLRLSAAVTIRELKLRMPDRSFSCFVIPLMRMVKDEEGTPCSRVVAAMALHDLHSAIGDYAIARQADFTGCERMKKACKWLAYYQLLEEHPELAVPEKRDSPGIFASTGQ